MSQFEVKQVGDSPDTWFALIPQDANGVTFYVAQALATAMDEDEMEMPPMENYVPADALNELWRYDTEFTIEFEYDDYNVSLSNNGRVRVEEQ